MLPIIENTIHNIESIDSEKIIAAQKHIDSLTKPPGSLGRLEELARQYIGIRGNINPKIDKKAVVIFAADHGVVEEGVSAYPQSVTQQMVLNFLNGGAAINVLANFAQADIFLVDIGVNYNFDSLPNLIHKKIAPGTKNMSQGPSMSRNQAEEAVQIGIEIAENCAKNEFDIICTGEMGIGNTTPSSAILSVYGEKKPKFTTGKGTGISDEQWLKKIAVIERAIENNKPKPKDPIDVLAKVGGFEIGGLAGLILGAASYRIPIVVDGLISGAAAVLALKMQPKVKDSIFVSHQSKELGHQVFFKLLDVPPLFDLGMRLGEGTGAVLGMQLIEASVKIYNEMATFKTAGISEKENN